MIFPLTGVTVVIRRSHAVRDFASNVHTSRLPPQKVLRSLKDSFLNTTLELKELRAQYIRQRLAWGSNEALRILHENGPTLSAQHAAATLQGLATLLTRRLAYRSLHGSEALYDHAMQLAAKTLHAANATDIAAVTHSTAVLQQVANRQHADTEQICRAAVIRSRSVLPDFRPQTLSTFLWALAKLRQKVLPDWLNAVVLAAAGGHMRAFKPGPMSNMLWGVARLATAPLPKDFIRVATARTHGLVLALSQEELGPVLWAAARLQLPVSRSWLQAFAGAVQRKLDRIPPEAEAEIMWAFAAFQQPDVTAEVFDSMLRRTNAPLIERSPHDLSQLAWAIASAGQPVSKVWVDELARAASKHMRKFTPSEFSALMWAFGKFGHSPLGGGWVSDVKSKVVPRLREMPAAQQDLVCQAFTKLESPFDLNPQVRRA